MALVSSIVTQGLELAGNTRISSATALNWVINFLNAEYRRKYPWQRRTVNIAFGGGVVVNAVNWDATFLDLYEQQDGSCGRWADAGGNINKIYALDYRAYVALIDRNTATGPPNRLVADDVGASWYVYPKTDKAVTVAVEIYYLPAAVALTDTPLWSTWAPDEILVQLVQVMALFHMDDARYGAEAMRLYGDPTKGVPGMLPSYRRRVMAREATPKQTALDQRVFIGMPAGDRDDTGTT